MDKEKITEITIDGVKMYKGEKEDDLREPRFLMPEKEGYQNDKARIIRRIGHKQLLVELYLFDERRTFAYWRFDKCEESLEGTKEMVTRMMNAYDLTITDILPTNFIEYKANFYKCKWLKSKSSQDEASIDKTIQ